MALFLANVVFFVLPIVTHVLFYDMWLWWIVIQFLVNCVLAVCLTKEFKHLKTNLMRLRDKYKNFVLISFIFDKNMITGYKDSPIDCGPDIFLQLFKERIVL